MNYANKSDRYLKKVYVMMDVMRHIKPKRSSSPKRKKDGDNEKESAISDSSFSKKNTKRGDSASVMVAVLSCISS